MSKYVVILDNGHGKERKGKRSPKGMLTDPDGTALFEYEFNRDIVCRMEPLLQAQGIEYHILVPESKDLSLGARCRRERKLIADNPGNSYFTISIHANAGKGTGWEVWTSPGQTESDVLAEFLYEAGERQLGDRWRFRSDTSDGDHDKESKFYILVNTLGPCALTENLFMDTKKDLAFLISDEGRQEIAELHVDGIKQYLESKN